MINLISSLPLAWQIVTWALVGLIAAVALYFLIRYWRTPLVKRILYHLVCQAEQAFGSQTGEIKFNAVLVWFYAQSPLLAIFFPEKLIRQWIEWAVTKLKTYLLTTGANLLSLSDETARAAPATADATPEKGAEG